MPGKRSGDGLGGDPFHTLLVLQNCSLLTILCLGYYLQFLLPASEEVWRTLST